jgi:type VI secretion system protein VasI
MFFQRISTATFALFCLALPALAEQDCTALRDDAARLSCYDLQSGYKQIDGSTPPGTGKWTVRIETSPMTDQTDVYLHLESETLLPARFGSGNAPADLFVRCRENTTSAFFVFNDHFMSDIQGYGQIEYRLDKNAMSKVGTDASTDNKALGLWSGGRAIPFLKSLFAHDQLIVRATPYNESALTVTFDIRGLEAASEKLRDACKW